MAEADDHLPGTSDDRLDGPRALDSSLISELADLLHPTPAAAPDVDPDDDVAPALLLLLDE
jgi:hypothetical protein